MLGFAVNALGAAPAAVQLTEWVTFTVTVAAILTGVIEFTQLRNHLVSHNLALRDLQKLLVKWDSLSVVNRRTGAIKTQFVDITERAMLMIAEAHTTAASNTQNNVEKSLMDEEDNEQDL